MWIDIQNNNRSTAVQNSNPSTTLPVVVFTLLGLLIACFVGWAFGFSIVVGSDSREPQIYAAYDKFSIALLADCIVAVIILVLACCFKEKLNEVAAGCLILAAATNLVMAFLLIFTCESYDKHKVPLLTWIFSSLPCLFWAIASLFILKLPVNEVDGTRTSTTEPDTEAFLT
jgi:hypothetical protein